MSMVLASATAGITARAAIAATKAAMRVRVNILASEVWGTYESAGVVPLGIECNLGHMSRETGTGLQAQTGISCISTG
jgi:hypothetical protein